MLGFGVIPPDIRFAKGRGCGACLKTGYRGRTAVREILEVTEPLRRSISRGALAEELRTEAQTQGFRSMRFQALKKVIAKVTTVQEVVRLTRS
jgi:type II secretory ATPase GspE/PulE/Tfp pilus assembly ATPase PilB-like protein